MILKIPFAAPDLDLAEIDEVIDTLKSGILSYGPKSTRLENDFKNYIGCQFAIAVNSGSSALHVALAALNLKDGDQVVVPVNTFTSTAGAVCYTPATPLFCDIDPQTFNINISKLKKLLELDTERKIKVVMPVHMAGQAADMGAILELKKQHGFIIVEDAAHAFPTTFDYLKIGSFGDITCFSFYPTKTLGTCEGGMVCTGNEEWAKRIKLLTHNGVNRQKKSNDQLPWFYDVEDLGFKYNMNDVAASIAIHQLRKAEYLLQKRKEMAHYYSEHFNNIPGLHIPFLDRPEDTHAWHLYIIKTQKRNELSKWLLDKGIGSSVHFRPLHLHSYWKTRFKLVESDFPDATKAYNEVLSLPFSTKLNRQDLDYVVQGVKDFFSYN